MNEQSARVAGLFDQVAETYDAVGVPWFAPIAEGLVRELDVREGERVLDVGCGRGAVLRLVAEAVGPGGRAVGVDLAPSMVALTAEDLRHLPQVELHVADASAPGLAAASVDVVASSLVLFFLPDPIAALRSWHDVLVPGGRVGVTTFGAQDERWQAVDALFRPYLPQYMLDARTRGTTGPFGSDQGVEGLLGEAGFVDLRTVSRQQEVVFADTEQWHTWTWSHGQRGMWLAIPEELRPTVRADAEAVLQEHASAEGRIAFRQVVRTTLGRRRE